MVSGELRERPFKCLPKTIVVPAVKEFTARCHFVVNSNETRMKISFIGEYFKKYYLPKVEKEEVAVEELALQEIFVYSYSIEIISVLGGEENLKITLGQFYEAFAQQPNGEGGSLPTNTNSNIGFARDVRGRIGPVEGRWYGSGWGFDARPLDSSIGWYPSNLVLSRANNSDRVVR